ncbi:hypothetical protein GCM10022631_13360 [Deinococcus rubellus]|uniref:transposase domain-containing protein n=1 Tax=Deinococcus rubellus TaxID=1889240 RepID=UPI0031E88792
MDLGTTELTGARDQPLDHLDTFTKSLDPALITQALTATGTASTRRRKLPADWAVWLSRSYVAARFRPCATTCIWSCPTNTGKRPSVQRSWFKRVTDNAGASTESDFSLPSGFDEHLPDHGVLMVDRGLMDDGRFYLHQRRGGEWHWLERARSNLVWTVLEVLGTNEAIVEVPF